MPKWEIWRLKFSVIFTPNLQNKSTIYSGIHHNTARNLQPEARVLWSYNEILCGKKPWIDPHRFTVMRCIISVAANTFDIP